MFQISEYLGKQIGNYQIIKEISMGTFGSIYLARHSFLSERTVAIKILHTLSLTSSEQKQDFLREAQFLEKLKHPHILPILDVGVDAGTPYLIVEYASRGSLRQLMLRRSSDPIPPAQALTVLSQVGKALQHAHQQNIVHRDLKPENILFNANDNALLADFGVSTILPTESIQQTRVIGTPTYMSPEQFQGVISKESDQYALGCIAYELLTGQKPFTAPEVMALAYQHMRELPISPRLLNPRLPVHVEQAILNAMAKERRERYPDVEAFINGLYSPSQTLTSIVYPVSEPLRLSERQSAPALVSTPIPTTIPTQQQAQLILPGSLSQKREQDMWQLYRQVRDEMKSPMPSSRVTGGMKRLAGFMYLFPVFVEVLSLVFADQSLAPQYPIFYLIIPLVGNFLYGLFMRAIFKLRRQRRPLVRFHTMQAIFLFNRLNVLAMIFVGVIVALNYTGYYQDDGTALLIASLLGGLFAIMWLIGMIGAFCGKYLRLPLVGKRALRFANRRQY